MTPRERNLLTVFLVAVAAIVFVFVVNALLEESAALDERLFKLQKQASQALSSRVERAQSDSENKRRLVTSWEKSLYDKGKTPKHLEFVSKIQALIQNAGLAIVSFSTIEEKSDSGWVQFNVRGSVGQWFEFIRNANRRSPQTLYRNVSMKVTDNLDYFVTVEVGYASLP